MTEQIAENIYRIVVPLENSPLKYTNSYVIKGTQENLIIDTGFRQKSAEEAMRTGLAGIGVDIDATDVLATHLHSDHTGMMDLFAGRDRHLYIEEKEYTILKPFIENNKEVAEAYDRYRAAGFSEEELYLIKNNNPMAALSLQGPDDRFTVFSPGHIFHYGGYDIEAISMPGHTPSGCMFWIESEGIMFTGDHVLFDISPNITAWKCNRTSLSDYLNSLKAARGYPVRIACPGHREAGNYHERIDALLAHHERRIQSILDILSETPDICAYEISGRMRWKIRCRSWAEFPLIQKYFAVGECLAHLDHMLGLGLITRSSKNGLMVYRAG